MRYTGFLCVTPLFPGAALASIAPSLLHGNSRKAHVWTAISRYDTCRVTTDYVQSREYHDHNVHPREPRKSLATGSNIFALLTKRRNGICAVALLIGASGAGVGVAAAVGAASASGQAGGWHAATGVRGGAWHSPAAQSSGGLQVGSHAGVTPHAAVPAPTSSGQNGSGPGPGRHGHWGGNGLGQRRRSGVPGRASSRDHHEFGDATTPSTRASGRWERGRGHSGPSGHRPAPRRSTGRSRRSPPIRASGDAAQRGGGQSSGDSQGKPSPRGRRAAQQQLEPTTPAPPRTSLTSGQAGGHDDADHARRRSPTYGLRPPRHQRPSPRSSPTTSHLASRRASARISPSDIAGLDRRLARGQPRAGHQRTRHRARPDPGPYQPPGRCHRAAPHSGHGRGHRHPDRHPRRGAQGRWQDRPRSWFVRPHLHGDQGDHRYRARGARLGLADPGRIAGAGDGRRNHCPRGHPPRQASGRPIRRRDGRGAD